MKCVVICLVTFLWNISDASAAELWRCKDANGRAQLTSAPVETRSTECTPLLYARGASVSQEASIPRRLPTIVRRRPSKRAIHFSYQLSERNNSCIANIVAKAEFAKSLEIGVYRRGVRVDVLRLLLSSGTQRELRHTLGGKCYRLRLALIH